jgi:Uma2 family endonuclease
MNVRVPLPTTRESFLDWHELQEGRYEFVRGRIVPVGGASLPHNVIATNMILALAARIDRDRYHVFVADYAVSTGDGIRYPDVTVVPVDRAARRFTEAPVFLVEIPSPTSTASDMRDKVADYSRIPGLAAYLVLSQDEAVAHLWTRGPEGFPAEPEVVTPALAPAIEIAALGVKLPFAELCRGVGSASAS